MSSVDLFMGMFIGGLLSFVFCLFIAGVWWFVVTMIDKQMKYVIPIMQFTGGQPTVKLYKAKKITDPEMRECYVIPALTKAKKQYLPFISSKYEFPMPNGKYFVNYVSFNNEETPIEFEPHIKERRDIITLWEDCSEEEKKQVSPERRAEIEKNIADAATGKGKKKDNFVRVTREVKVLVMRPVNKSIRKWVVDTDRQLQKENPLNSTFWDENKKEILAIGLMLVVGAICLFLIIFSYQHADKVLQSAASVPSWAQSVINATQQNISIPKLG